MDEDKKNLDKQEKEDTPLGALFVTGTLAVVILLLWFSMYILNFIRS